MSDDISTSADQGGGNSSDDGARETSRFEPITSQDALDRIISNRVNRVKAHYSDYEDLKAQVSNISGLKERINELEATNVAQSERIKGFEAAEERRGLVARVADEAGVPAELLAAFSGSTEDELKAGAELYKKHLKAPAPFVSRQSERPSNAVNESTEFVKNLFRSK